MKKIGTLNSEITSVISRLGHTDTIVIGDCGLPIPSHVQRIDLALKRGTPTFIETLETVLEEMKVEAFWLAKEIKDTNTRIEEEILNLISDASVTYLSHDEFKELTKNAKAVIRTGEDSPYANIILQSGVIF
jgi:D-ribose pyranase